ncbi:MAG: hypothetical protein ACLPXM_00805 [Terriglobales bacterium]
MTTHPYLRAYMAGIAVPSVFMLVIFAGFCLLRFGYRVEVPLERAVVFPLALVPNMWGAWNMLYLATHRRLPLGIHGAILPAIVFPVALIVAHAVVGPFPGFFTTVMSLAVPVVLIIYYLVWKYIVSFLNRMLGIA